jgi:hypothetical protein
MKYASDALEKLNDYIIERARPSLTPSDIEAADRIKAQITLLLDSQPRSVRHEVATFMFNSFIKHYY